MDLPHWEPDGRSFSSKCKIECFVEQIVRPVYIIHRRQMTTVIVMVAADFWTIAASSALRVFAVCGRGIEIVLPISLPETVGMCASAP